MTRCCFKEHSTCGRLVSWCHSWRKFWHQEAPVFLLAKPPRYPQPTFFGATPPSLPEPPTAQREPSRSPQAQSRCREKVGSSTWEAVGTPRRVLLGGRPKKTPIFGAAPILRQLLSCLPPFLPSCVEGENNWTLKKQRMEAKKSPMSLSAFRDESASALSTRSTRLFWVSVSTLCQLAQACPFASPKRSLHSTKKEATTELVGSSG